MTQNIQETASGKDVEFMEKKPSLWKDAFNPVRLIISFILYTLAWVLVNYFFPRGCGV